MALNGLVGLTGASPQLLFPSCLMFLLWGSSGVPEARDKGILFLPIFLLSEWKPLSCLLKRVVEGNFISGCRFWGRDGGHIVISHLLYNDDTIFFCEANSEQLMYLRWTLMWFEAFLGWKINLNKSVIIPLGRVDNVDGGDIVISHLLYDDDTILFCEVNSEQLMYLR